MTARGRVVLVVGGSSGIGLATARHLAGAGDTLALVSRDGDALQRAAKRCRNAGGADVGTWNADVLDGDEVARVVGEVVDRYGRIDAVVHTATVMAYGRLAEMPADVFRTVVDTAIHGTVHVAQAALPHLQKAHGTLVVVNSLLGSVAVPTMGAYATAKWGQRAVARTLQQELRASGVHVCIVSPGGVNTPIYYQGANFLGKSARPPIPVLQPERVGARIAALLDRPRNHLSIPVGPANPVVVAGFRLLPWLYDRIVEPLFRIGALIDEPAVRDNGNVHEAVSRNERMHGRWPSMLARTQGRDTA